MPQVEEFRYLGVLFMSDRKRDCEIGRRLGQAAVAVRSLYWTVVVKRELSHKAKLSIYRLIYIPTLTYSHELWVMTERMRSSIHAMELFDCLRLKCAVSLHVAITVLLEVLSILNTDNFSVPLITSSVHCFSFHTY